MSAASASQFCDPVSSSAQAAQIAADVRREGSEGGLIIPDTSKPGLSPYLPLILPLKTGAHLGVHPHAVGVINTRHGNRLACDRHTFGHTHTHVKLRLRSDQRCQTGFCATRAFCQRSGFVHAYVSFFKKLIKTHTHTKPCTHQWYFKIIYTSAHP